MNKRRFFLHLQRFNTVAVFLGIVTIFTVVIYENYFSFAAQRTSAYSDSEFGNERESTNSIIGDPIETKSAELVAYYEESDLNERKTHAGITIVDPATNRTLEIAQRADERLISLDYIHNQGEKDGPVIGYIALVSSEKRLSSGRADLVLGALPAMTKNVVATDILYSDLPKVRGDGAIGVILWPEDDVARVTAFRLEDGSVIDSKQINLPQIKSNSLSQGPGIADDPSLRRDSEYSNVRPIARFGYID
mgnify:CR=1 FL=1